MRVRQEREKCVLDLLLRIPAASQRLCPIPPPLPARKGTGLQVVRQQPVGTAAVRVARTKDVHHGSTRWTTSCPIGKIWAMRWKREGL